MIVGYQPGYVDKTGAVSRATIEEIGVLIKIVYVLTLLLMVVNQPQAQDLLPELIEPEQREWISPPPVPGLKFLWVTGSEQQQGLYALRVKLDQNTRIPPHTHPDQRLSTVLSGTLYVGFGDVFDESKLIAITAGNSYIAPAQTPHFIWAKESEVIYQETGVGPTGTQILE